MVFYISTWIVVPYHPFRCCSFEWFYVVMS